MEKDKELLIEAYFTKTLTTNQQKQLEWLLQNDPVFSEAFNFEKEIRDTVIYNERQALKERFRTLDKQQLKPVRKQARWWYAAASILVLIGATWFFLDNQYEATTEKLYTQYMEPYPNVVTPMVRGDNSTNEIISEALMLYDKREYRESEVLLQQAYNDQPNDHTAFYLAICQLILQKPREALTLLESRDWKDASYFSPGVVNWYCGLAYLQLGDGEQALPRFKLVADSDDSLSAKARLIVKALEKKEEF